MRKPFSATRTVLVAAASLLALLAAFGALLALLPLRYAIQIGADEGLALSKAVLYANGYKFYSEVWNDQPLLHTFLISQVTKYVCASILGPRLLTSAFAMVLLASIFGITLRLAGLWAATLATAFLIASPAFLELSSSCMVEVPALTVPVAALCLPMLGGARNSDCARKRWMLRLRGKEVLAGALFGIGLHIKFNAAIYLPLATLILWLDHRRNSSNRAAFFLSLAAFLVALAASFIGVHSLIGEGSYALQFQQSWAAHVAPPRTAEYGSPEEHAFPWSIILRNWDMTIPAALGVFLLLRNFRRGRRSSTLSRSHPPTLLPSDLTVQRFNDLTSLFPVAWLGLTLLVFVPHKPWWPYYYLHISVPLCACAAMGFCRVWVEFRARHARPFISATLLYGVCALVWMGLRLQFEISAIRESPQLYSCLALKEIEPLKPFTRFIFTDQPIFSFHSKIPIPPSLAMITLKRMWSGEMTINRIENGIRAIKPGIILLKNESSERTFDLLFSREYRLIYEDDEHRLYALTSVIERVNQ